MTPPEATEKPQAGRPPHVPTTESRDLVASAAGGGMRHEEIAIGLGISEPTLRKHYSEELSTGAHQKRVAVLQALEREAMKGKPAAVRLYLQIDPQLAAPPLEGEEEPEEKLGKKAQADKDAKSAAQGTEWSDLLGGSKVVPIR